LSQKSDPDLLTKKNPETKRIGTVTHIFREPLKSRQYGRKEREKTRVTLRSANFRGTNREKLPKQDPKRCGHFVQGRRFWRLILMRDDVWKRQKNAKIEPNPDNRTRPAEKAHSKREKESEKDRKTDVRSGAKRRGKNARRQFFEEARSQT
jgi:hypothetical protein